MAAGLILAAYLLTGCAAAWALFPDRGVLWRGWFGCAAGLLLFMWLPALFAFRLDFTMDAQWASLGALAVIACACGIVLLRRGRRSIKEAVKGEAEPVRAFVGIVPLLTVVAAYLQYTHTLRPVGDALYAGQSTYGDLSLHLSIATSLRNASFPPEYALLPGTRLAYPFLMDTLSTSLMLWGMPLRWSFIIPGTLMCALVFTGILLLAWQLTRSEKVSALTLLLLVFCGGFGFLYSWDLIGEDPSRFLDIFTEFYRAPANLTEVNIRWSNLLVDMWLPQRTFLSGWVLLLPALSLVIDLPKEKRIWRAAITAGLFAGGMPLVHTHSFLALGLFSAGYLGWSCAERREGSLTLSCVVYLAITLTLALPQLIAFTFEQSSADGFVRLHFNWVNGTGGGLRDSYLYFWIKNVGPPMLLVILMLFDMPREHRPVAVGAFLIFIAAELIEFQPNDYDNNKLFYVWYLIILPCALAFGARVYQRLKGIRARGIMAVAFVLVSITSGVLSVIREGMSEYELYSANAMAVARYVEDNTPPDAVILTAVNHNNPVSAVAGRKVVCGPSVFLYFHGLDYQEKADDVVRFYINPVGSRYVIEDNDVSYILVGDYEKAIPGMDEDEIAKAYALVFESGGYRLYKTSDPAEAGSTEDAPNG
ncbi:MAG: hypothetical protein LBB86_06255 [Oscillospiraceae bacterium]|jgi:hypothetical protein|nr:hypothetical protein [Oscillospiraceae bacterium]